MRLTNWIWDWWDKIQKHNAEKDEVLKSSFAELSDTRPDSWGGSQGQHHPPLFVSEG